MILRAVIDLMDGVVVRGVRGQRHLYRPIQSCLTSSTRPRDIAAAIHETTGIDHFYLADLDAIQKGIHPDWDLAHWFEGQGWNLWLDAGLRSWQDLESWPTGTCQPVIGTETFVPLSENRRLPDHLVPILSLDTLNGEMVGQGKVHYAGAFQAFQQGWKAGIETMILMELSRIGSGEGPSGLPDWMPQTRSQDFHALKLYAAGGVRGRSDLATLGQSGFAGALVSSMLHQAERPEF